MKEQERVLVTGLVCLLLIVWLGFLVHRSPRFPGSLTGHLIGITGSTLMLVPLGYMIVKRIGPLKRRVTAIVSMRTLLTIHVYCGVLGPILVLIHSAHRFESPLGIALTTMTLLLVLSGFTGRYLMIQITRDLREERGALAAFQKAYQETARELASEPAAEAGIRPFSGFLSRLILGFFVSRPEKGRGPMPAIARAVRISESMADVEYAIKTHEFFKKLFGAWLKFHISMSLVLYLLLGLHVWASIYFGLRWLS